MVSNHYRTIKTDTIGLHWSMVPPFFDGGELVSKALIDYKKAGDELCKRVFDATKVEGYRPEWLKQKELQFEDLYCKEINIGTKFDKRKGEFYHFLKFDCVKNNFEFRIEIHFNYLPRFFWSGSLFNFHMGNCVDIDVSINNPQAFDNLLYYLERFKKRCREVLCFDKDGLLNQFDTGKWILHRLDLAADYKLGPDAVMANLEELSGMFLPGYSKAVYHEYYKVNFLPAMRDDRLSRVRRPTISVYNKSDELINFMGKEKGHYIPENIFEDGWLRVELQFFQGMNRKDMSRGFAKQVRTGIMEQKFTDDDLLQLYNEYDVIGRRLIRGDVRRVEEDVTRKLYSYFKQNHGCFTIRGLEKRIGFDRDGMIVVRKVVVGLCAQGLVEREGHQYFVHEEFYDSLVAGKIVIEVPEMVE